MPSGYYPGFFVVVELGKATLGPPEYDIDVSNLSFVVVLNEGDVPPRERFSTWGMQADSALIYQTLGSKNQIFTGDAGNIYVLTEGVVNDAGGAIPVTMETGPLPQFHADVPTTATKRLHEVHWQVNTPPPSTGHQIVLTVTDMDNPNHRVVKQVAQFDTRARVQVSITARQFRLRWDLITRTEFDPIAFGYKYQQLRRPYASITGATNG